ncbi:ABC transporter ATP-binding protein [Cupriavidus sp. TA19]|uniref:ABC transporter ATP-binding protein n=1 Tax=unclassified Cupriavidus TaxID=2640874 RepID=UPI000E2F2313|nr:MULTISPECIES: ABC transporter ATP-binding protein [unclassified Cupriavidus]BDB30705.1 ABC transporter ATP-binding protein [Cupriavidus sp. P-10]GLC91781.1 ABC transporter ATP-binding protein [Cupriavidus sp. TA19]
MNGITNRELRLDQLSASYGSSHILHGVSMRVRRGEVSCLLGLNGMGKTTTLRAILGLVDRQEGQIVCDGRPLQGSTHRRARAGVTLVPEDRKVFASLSVRDNLEVARQPATEGSQPFTIDDATRLFPRLAERMDQLAGTLSGGEQQMLVVARAMVANPRYILLDEPTEGLAPNYVGAIHDAILEMRERGIGVLLVEQSLALATAVGDHFQVIESGHIVFSETRERVLADPASLEKRLTVE